MTSASRICLAGNQRTHPGRPETEDPHVKKTTKNKREIIEYICKVDQDGLGILEDEFDDLKDLFKVISDHIVYATSPPEQHRGEMLINIVFPFLIQFSIINDEAAVKTKI